MKVIVDDQFVEYSDEGSGKVVLMLHGWGQTLATFDELAKNLAKDFRVIRFDFPGFGGSPRPKEDWSVVDYALNTQAILKKLGIDDLYAVIGHSFGGRVVIKGFNNNIFNPKKVILIGAAGIKHSKSSGYKIIAKVGKLITSLPILKQLQPKLRRILYKKIGNEDYINSNDMKKIFLNTINEDLSDEVKSINAPTLLIWGKEDTETPVADAKLMNSSIAGSKLSIFDDAGHFVYQEKFDEVIKLIRGFLI